MSQPAFKALDLPFELVYSDGEPLETYSHRIQMNLLIDSIYQLMEERGRTDFFAGGNMFVYYSVEQAQEVVAAGPPYFRGPDVFFVDNVKPNSPRDAWIAWEEGGRLPDMIVELLSPSTARNDRTVKKDLYARVFRTRDYFLYDFNTVTLEGFHLVGHAYRPIEPDPQGRLWSETLGVSLGIWHGVRLSIENNWVRLFHPDGRMVPIPEELAEAERARAAVERQRADAERQQAEVERQRAEAERLRAEAAEAELARLRALLDERNSGR